MTIDVLLPCHGPEELVRAAVRSVLAQTHADWRMHVVDDDPANTWLEAWLLRVDDPRVSYVRHAHRHGVNATFRHCLALGTSPHLTVMGSDDLMRPAHLATAAALAERFPEAAMIQPGVAVIDASGQPVRPLADRVKARLAPRAGAPLLLQGEAAAVSLLRGNWLYFPSLVWRRDRMQAIGFRPGLHTTLDLMLELELLLGGDSLLVHGDVTFDYRRHPASASSLTARSAERFDEELAVYAEVADRCRARGWRRAARMADLHPSSRLHAAQTALAVGRAGDRRVATDLAAKALGLRSASPTPSG